VLDAELAVGGESELAPGGSSQLAIALPALHGGLAVAEHDGELLARRALHVHEEGVGVLDESLQLVLLTLLLRVGVQQVLGQRHCDLCLLGVVLESQLPEREKEVMSE